jgi:hypothetical protein
MLERCFKNPLTLRITNNNVDYAPRRALTPLTA